MQIELKLGTDENFYTQLNVVKMWLNLRANLR